MWTVLVWLCLSLSMWCLESYEVVVHQHSKEKKRPCRKVSGDGSEHVMGRVPKAAVARQGKTKERNKKKRQEQSESLPSEATLPSSPVSTNVNCTQVGRSDTSSTRWQSTHRALRQQKGITEQFLDWTKHKKVSGVPRTARYLDVINYASHCYQLQLLQDKAREDPAVAGDVRALGDAWKHCPYVCDYTQSADRSPWTAGHVRSICANSSFYHFGMDRVLLPKEHLMLLGWSSSTDVSGLSQSAIRDLAGESMACPCVCAVMAAVALSLPGVWEC